MEWPSFFGGPRRRLEHLLEALFAMRVGQDVGEILSETLDQVRGILNARNAMLFFFESQEEQLYRWISGPGGGGPQAAVELPPAENTRWIDFSGPVHLEQYGPEHPMSQRLKAASLVSIGSIARGNCSRLIIV